MVSQGAHAVGVSTPLEVISQLGDSFSGSHPSLIVQLMHQLVLVLKWQHWV